MYGKGISREGSLLDVAVELGFVKKSGAWFTYEGEQLGQGRENVKTYLNENPQLMAEIDERVRSAWRPETRTRCRGALDPDDLPISLDVATAVTPPLTASKRSGPAPALPRGTGPERFASDHDGATPARETKHVPIRFFDRFVPTVPFRYLPPKQSVRMAYNVVLDREPDARRGRLRPQAGERVISPVVASPRCWHIPRSSPPGADRQRAPLDARQP